MNPVIVASARIHGITYDDMLQAYSNLMRVFELYDLRHADRRRRIRQMLEIGIAAEGLEFIVHAMPARATSS